MTNLSKLSLIASFSSLALSSIVLFNQFNLGEKAVNSWNDFFYPYPSDMDYISGCMTRASKDLGDDFTFSVRIMTASGCKITLNHSDKGAVQVYEYAYDRKTGVWGAPR